MIKISAAVNSGRSPAEKQGQKQSGTRISVFPFSSGFPGIASALSRDTIFSKKSGYMVEITGKSVILYIEPL